MNSNFYKEAMRLDKMAYTITFIGTILALITGIVGLIMNEPIGLGIIIVGVVLGMLCKSAYDDLIEDISNYYSVKHSEKEMNN